MNLKTKIGLRTLSAFIGGYLALVAPAVPYTIQDIRAKQGTEQMAGFPGWHSFGEIGKTLYGGLVWYPVSSIDDMQNDKKKLLFIVNKETQQLFIYDGNMQLQRTSQASTGRDVEKPTRKFYRDDVTPDGNYIAVKSFDSEGLKEWFGPERAPYYGNGMILFMGNWFPNIAIHGTNRESRLGEESSRGCPRVDAETIDWIMQNAGAGSRMLVQPYGIIPQKTEGDFDFWKDQSKYIKQRGAEQAKEDFLWNNPQIEKIEDIVKGTTIFLGK